MKIHSGLRLLRNLGVSLAFATVLINVAFYLGFGSPGSWIMLPLGLFYGVFFEYVYHRWFLHSNIGFLAAKHRVHHRDYHGEEFRTTDRYRGNISEDWGFFPVALLIHASAMLVVLGSIPAVLVLSLWIFYAQFEVFHWATHMEGNIIDRLLLKLPVTRTVREVMILHHFIHHDMPKMNYNFTEPYLGDHLLGTYEGIVIK